MAFVLAVKLVLGVLPKSLFSLSAFYGRGFSLNTSRRMKLTIVRIPKNTKHPSHPNLGKITELATIPRFAAIALAKYKIL